MSDQSVLTLSAGDREAMVLRYWRRGDLTPLRLANALARNAMLPVEGAARRDDSGSTPR